MREVLKSVKRFLVGTESRDAATAVEYAVMLALIVVVCITAITSLGTNVNKTVGNGNLNGALAGGS